MYQIKLIKADKREREIIPCECVSEAKFYTLSTSHHFFIRKEWGGEVDLAEDGTQVELVLILCVSSFAD